MGQDINLDYKLKKLKLNKKLILSLVSLIIIVILSIALSINSVFNKKFEQYIIRNNENGCFERICDFTPRELREGHNIGKMYVAGEFN